jgi:hypothetical protein
MMTNGDARLMGARFLLLAAAALTLLPACSATRLTDVWKDPGHEGGPFRQVAVFAFGGDEAGDRLTEDEFVHRLPATTRGVSGHRLVPPAERGDVDRVRERLRVAGFDGVILAWTVGGPEARDRPVAYRTFGDAYAALLQDAPRGGDGRPGEPARLHAFVYRVATDALVWSATSRRIAPADLREVTAGVARVVMERLQEAGLLAET